MFSKIEVIQSHATARAFIKKQGFDATPWKQGIAIYDEQNNFAAVLTLYNDDSVVVITDVIVREEYQNMGLGRKLIAYIVDWALKQSGFTKVIAYTSNIHLASTQMLKDLGVTIRAVYELELTKENYYQCTQPSASSTR